MTPLALIACACASAMATRAQVTTRAMSATAPMSLRRRMGMFVRSIAGAASQLYGPRRRHQASTRIRMAPVPPPASAHRRAVRLWLLAVAALMVATVVVGGATRLTESGLSIVEWKPVTGVLPPLDQAAWQAEFDKYKTIPQYRERNAG